MSLYLVPRWGGAPTSDFYPWLASELEARQLDRPTALAMPTPDEPTIEAWVAAIGDALPRDPGALARTVLVGHSVGCQAILRWLSRLPDGVSVRGVLCVAGWWTVDRPWPTLRPWIDTSFDVGRVRVASARLVTLLSDDDPFTADFGANQRAWEERVGAQVHVVPGAKHFNAGVEPAVREALLAQFL
jgi:predicted alpha/beta hydrolase family esterase